MRVLIFDTETAGLPKKYIKAEDDLNNYPPICQFTGTLIEVENTPNGILHKEIVTINQFALPVRKGKTITIEPKAQEVHNYSTQLLNNIGVPIEDIVLSFIGLLNSADIIVAHNLFFDRNIMISEALNIGIQPTHKRFTRSLCTMRFLTPVLKIPRKYGSDFKFPSLEETYKFLLKDDMHNHFKAHDSVGDVGATIAILMELLNTSTDFANTFFNKNEQFLY